MSTISLNKTGILFIIIIVAGYFGTYGCTPLSLQATSTIQNTPTKVNTDVITSDHTSTEEMIITYYSDYRPLSWTDENGTIHGALVDILEEALHKRMGIAVKHLGYPWMRAQEMVRQGKADAYCTVPTEERRTYTLISQEEIFVNQVSVFTNKGSPRLRELSEITSIDDLKSLKMSNYSGNGWAKQRLGEMDITWVTTPQQALQMVVSGRAEAYVDSSPITNNIIKEMDIQDIIELPVVLDTTSYHLCVGKNSPFKEILPEFDGTIRKMKEEGTLDTILSAYISSNN